MLRQVGFPTISPLLRDRRFTFALVVAVGIHLVLVSAGLPSWQCPFLHLTGIPCPGCGLTRALMLLVQGDLQAALRLHAFAPLFLLAILTMVLAAVMPQSVVRPMISKTEVFERQTGFAVVVLIGLLIYWLVRLFLFPTAFAI